MSCIALLPPCGGGQGQGQQEPRLGEVCGAASTLQGQVPPGPGLSEVAGGLVRIQAAFARYSPAAVHAFMAATAEVKASQQAVAAVAVVADKKEGACD